MIHDSRYRKTRWTIVVICFQKFVYKFEFFFFFFLRFYAKIRQKIFEKSLWFFIFLKNLFTKLIAFIFKKSFFSRDIFFKIVYTFLHNVYNFEKNLIDKKLNYLRQILSFDGKKKVYVKFKGRSISISKSIWN